eukprot:gene8611-32998_t
MIACFLWIAVSVVREDSSCCELLQWDQKVYQSVLYNTSSTGTTMGFGSPDICASSKNNGECTGPVSWFDAVATCKNANARLCTAQELADDESHGSGCNFDFDWVWSSTPCDLECYEGDVPTGYRVKPGFSASVPDPTAEKCVSPIDEQAAVVRCCANKCAEEDLQNAPATSPPPPSPAPSSNANACTAEGDSDACKCERGNSAAECALLGSVVGTQDASVKACHIVTCADLNSTYLRRNLPSSTTKVDLQRVDIAKFSSGASTNLFAGLSNLEIVYIEGSPITEVGGGIFSDCAKMRVLELSHIDIVTLPKSTFLGLENLEQLTMVQNSDWSSIAAGTFLPLVKLKELVLRSHPKLRFAVLDRMPALNRILLANLKGMDTLPNGMFGNLPKLKSMTLEWNAELHTIEEGAFKGAGSLEELHIVESRNLTTVDDNAFAGLTSLETLEIRCNAGGITAIKQKSLAQLPALKHLVLQVAGLTSIEDDAFAELASLEVLTIAKAQKLAILPATLMRGLEASLLRFELIELGIRSLPDELLAGMDSLQKIKFACLSALQSIPKHFFAGVQKRCEEVSIHKTGLRSLAVNMFAGLTKLHDLSITSNAFLTRLEASTFDNAFDETAGSVRVKLENNPFEFISSRAINFDDKGAPERTTLVTVSSMQGTRLDNCCTYAWLHEDHHFITSGVQCLDSRSTASGTNASVVALGGGDHTFGCCFEDTEWEAKITAINNVTAVGSYASLSDDIRGKVADLCRNSMWNQSTKLRDMKSGGTAACTTPIDPDCTPSIQPWFNLKYVESDQRCSSRSKCPSGYRAEAIGQRHLLNCEPFLHAPRQYETEFAVAEQLCVACAVPHCKSCSGNYRLCEACSPGYSLDIESTSGTLAHACISTCKQGFFSGAVSEIAENSSTAVVAVKGRQCFQLTECGEGQQEREPESDEANPYEFTDRVCQAEAIPTPVDSGTSSGNDVGAVIGVFFVLSLIAIALPGQDNTVKGYLPPSAGGQRPYHHLGNDDVMKAVIRGQTAPQPKKGCTDEIYSVISQCWQLLPKDRPTFEQLLPDLEKHLEDVPEHDHRPKLRRVNTKQAKANERWSSLTKSVAEQIEKGGVIKQKSTLALKLAAKHGPVVVKPKVKMSAEEYYSQKKKEMYKRVLSKDCQLAKDDLVSPFAEIDGVVLVSLYEAVDAFFSHSNDGFVDQLQEALAFAQDLVDAGESQGLTVDEAAAIHFYTSQCLFYVLLNGVLGGWGKGGREPLPLYLPYSKLALSALNKLPHVEATVYRGVQGVPLEKLLGGKVEGHFLTWWAFTSTTESSDVLRKPYFLGFTGEHRTVFVLKVKSGVRIKRFSSFGGDEIEPESEDEEIEGIDDEDEVLIKPGTQFVITSIKDYDGVTEVSMTEVVKVDVAVDVDVEVDPVAHSHDEDGYMRPKVDLENIESTDLII